jgi:hypothetical protein
MEIMARTAIQHGLICKSPVVTIRQAAARVRPSDTGRLPLLFFFRYWRSTGDRLFVIFAVAFLLMCLTRFVAALIAADNPHNGYVYTIRFIAYLLILAAIIDKNRN